MTEQEENVHKIFKTLYEMNTKMNNDLIEAHKHAYEMSRAVYNSSLSSIWLEESIDKLILYNAEARKEIGNTKSRIFEFMEISK